MADNEHSLCERGLKLSSQFKETSQAIREVVKALRTQEGKLKEGDPIATKLALLFMEYKALSRDSFSTVESAR